MDVDTYGFNLVPVTKVLLSKKVDLALNVFYTIKCAREKSVLYLENK